MSDSPAPAAPPAGGPEGAAPPKAPNKMILPLIVTLMTLAGAGVGAMVVAPKLIATRNAAAGLEPEPADEEEAAAHEGGEGGEAGPMFKIDNLIVNPAGSQGSRFLMVSVAVETSDAKLEAHLRGREPQIRDVVIALLEQRTMDELSLPGMRDSIKVQLADTISQIAGVKKPLKVFLPQFVIQ